MTKYILVIHYYIIMTVQLYNNMVDNNIHTWVYNDLINIYNFFFKYVYDCKVGSWYVGTYLLIIEL